MIATLKRIMPWWAKIAAKLVLARLPLGGRAWQTLGLFAPGEMRDPAYALSVFERHYRAAGAPAPGFTFLELGPGDSLASAVVGAAFGATQGWLVDAGAYASRDMGVYRRLIEAVRAEKPDAKLLDELAGADDTEGMLAAAHTQFLENGLQSLRTLPDACCDIVFSQAVLEHVPRDEFPATLSEIRRILKPTGAASHQIDFRDHLSSGLNNLRFSDATWESPWFAQRSGFYTNRIRPSEMLKAFRSAGFEVEIMDETRWNDVPIASTALAEPFRDLPSDDLLIRDMFVVLHTAEEPSS